MKDVALVSSVLQVVSSDLLQKVPQKTAAGRERRLWVEIQIAELATGRPVELGEEGLFLGQVPILFWKVTACMLGLSERQGCSLIYKGIFFEQHYFLYF